MHNNHRLGHKTAKTHVCAYNTQYNTQYTIQKTTRPQF